MEMYDYDPAGNRAIEQVDGAVTVSSFDNMNRLTTQVPGGSLVFRGTTNEPATVTVATNPAATTAGNQFTGSAAVAGSGTTNVAVKATDPNGNIRTNTYQVAESGATKNFTYDANGNLTGDGTKTYIWDNGDRLVEVKQGATSLAAFNYNGFGLRGNKIVGATSVTYVYERNQITEDRPSAGSTTRYIYGPGIDRPLAQVSGGATTYNDADHLQTVVRTTNSTGAPIHTREYDPWGNPLQGAATAGSAFTGREWDAETGLYYYRARYYDPKPGRFLSADPIGLKGGVNYYSYVGGNPLRRVDPRGLWAGGVGAGGGVALVPPLPLLGFTGSAGCLVVVDGQRNVGLLCCVSGGPALGGAVEIGEQGAGTFCPTCRSICDLEDWSFYIAGGAAAGPDGAMGSGGGYMNESGGGVAAFAGPAQGFGAYGGFEIGVCKLYWKKKPCCP